MGLWHGVEHFEKMKINEQSPVELFVKSWPPVLAENVEFKYDWSYIVSWVGVGMALCSSILFSLAAVCIKNDREREEAMNMQYLMPGKTTLCLQIMTFISSKGFLLGHIIFTNT